MNGPTRTFLIVLFLLLVSSSACAQNPPPRELKVESEPFGNDDFEISLPANWKPDHDDASFGWQDGNLMQEIRIMVMHINKGQSVEKAVNAYFDIRKKTLEEFSGGPANISDINRSKSASGEIVLKFRVDDKNRQVRMCTVIRANTNRLVSFTFLKYAPLLPFDEVDKRCQNLVEKLVVKD